MNPNDEILKHIHRVDQRANQLADDLINELEAVRERLIGKLGAVADKLKGDFNNAPLKRQKKLLEAQKAEVESILADVYQDKAPAQLKAAAADVIDGTADFTVNLMNTATGLDITLGRGLTKELVVNWFETATVDGLLINDWLTKLETAARDRIVSIGRQSLVEGLPVDAMARLLRNQGIGGSVPGLKGLARTFLLSASHQARETTTNEYFGDVITGWRRSVVLDGRTCIRCGPYDGKLYAKNEPKPMLPAHWNCRCIYLAESKSWSQLTGQKVDEPDTGTKPAVKHSSRWVNHRDGSRSRKFTVESAEQVPASMTYERWLKGQLEKDPAFVRSVFGKARYGMFKAGKLSLSRMVTQGRIKSLDAMD